MHARTQLLVIAISVPIAMLGWCGPARAGGTVTQRIYEGQFSLPIPATPGDSKGWMDDAIIDVPDHITIQDLDVGLTLTHTSVFDLQLMLTSPSGTTVVLNAYDSIDDYFVGQDYDQTLFDDEALISIQDGAAPFTGRFRPVESLGAFDGQDAYGLWRLRIYDMSYGDTGNLETYRLAATVPTIPAPSAIVLTVSGLGFMGFAIGRRLRSRALSGLFQ